MSRRYPTRWTPDGTVRRLSPGAPMEARLMHRIERAEDGCWNWQGALTRGYGALGVDGKGQLAHRMSYETFVGPIPEGMTVDHLCFNPRCINPEHLQLLSHVENCRKQRKALSPTCGRGHEFTPQNTRYRSDGSRRCRECAAINWRAWVARRAS